MNIEEMHILFRTIGQQNGMQTVRAILPQAIDIYLNIAIIEKVKEIANQNVSTPYQDKITLQDNSISATNALRTICRTQDVEIDKIEDSIFNSADIDDSHILFFTSFSLIRDNKEIACRLIDIDKIEETNRDYCNRASLEYPIVTLQARDKNLLYCKIYPNTTDNVLRFKYIAKPASVHYSKIISERIDCNLPEHLHSEIVELAVRKYFESIGSTTQQVQ